MLLRSRVHLVVAGAVFKLLVLDQWVMEQLNRWFNFAERLLYTSVRNLKKLARVEKPKTPSTPQFSA
jgi:hypothetical protein